MTSIQQKGLPSERVRDSPSVSLDYLDCAICRDLLWKPIACQLCETPFCSPCINQWLVNNPNKCPNRCETYTERKCPPFIAKLLAQLQIACFYESNGCEQVISYEALDKHELECGYQTKQCPGCALEMLKKDFPSHKKTCELIQLTCKDCKLMYKKSEVTTKHTENMCLKKQLKRLKHECKESKTEIQKLNSQLTEMRQLTNSFLTQEIITFDDLPSALHDTLYMPISYKGLIWTKFSYMHETYAIKKYAKSGYMTSYKPGGSLQIAFFREPATINTGLRYEAFTLASLTASAAWNDDLQLTITAYRYSVEINTHNVTLLFGRPQRINLQWKNIDKVIFKASGGIAHPGSGQGTGPHVIITQLTLNNLVEAKSDF